jgi:hypothetical protein
MTRSGDGEGTTSSVRQREKDEGDEMEEAKWAKKERLARVEIRDRMCSRSVSRRDGGD